jgi:hypothetical protein
VGSLHAKTGLITSSSAHLSYKLNRAIRTIASELPARTRRLSGPGSRLFNSQVTTSSGILDAQLLRNNNCNVFGRLEMNRYRITVAITGLYTQG